MLHQCGVLRTIVWSVMDRWHSLVDGGQRGDHEPAAEAGRARDVDGGGARAQRLARRACRQLAPCRGQRAARRTPRGVAADRQALSTHI